MSVLKRNANIFRNVIWSKLCPTPIVQQYQQSLQQQKQFSPQQFDNGSLIRLEQEWCFHYRCG